ncbi:hypothetical protein TSAR_002712 [Trichomalopsis sarcophagae]|uniref:MADF domain-containing protein n=1 Tax=Trichomalopsis sarcophagae TaxID=543379 RepID=A0A232EDG3_9HYME|nr:hypothetical protein TSAR_002712 [Trichomalopsis sarcophagae]
MQAYEQIIVEEIQARPFIYNSIDLNHRNREKRKEAFIEISVIVNRVHPKIAEEIDGDGVARVYKNLRKHYCSINLKLLRNEIDRNALLPRRRDIMRHLTFLRYFVHHVEGGENFKFQCFHLLAVRDQVFVEKEYQLNYSFQLIPHSHRYLEKGDGVARVYKNLRKHYCSINLKLLRNEIDRNALLPRRRDIMRHLTFLRYFVHHVEGGENFKFE